MGAISIPALKILGLLHLREPSLRALHRAEIKHRTEFYSDSANARRIEVICQSLGDQESVDTFLRAIKFQQTYDWDDAPAYTPNHYFADGVIALTGSEVFVDCGAFTGDTVRAFVKRCGGSYSKIVCLEPDAKNFRRLSRTTRKYHDVTLVPVGAWKRSGTLQFSTGMRYCSKLTEAEVEDAGASVPVAAIDDLKVCQDMTLLKMDIEGAELDALRGAEKTIRAARPKLAISIYHSPEDMLGIPEYVGAEFPGYKLFVRHHFRDDASETVLYAIPEG
jgi:FkbM family methyltransferase